MIGQILALLTAFCWAQNSIFYHITGKRAGSRTVTHIRLWIALPAVIIVHRIFLGSFIPHEPLTENLVILFVSGFVGFFIADVFIFYGFVAIGPGITLLIMTLSPILSAVISFFTLGESLTLIQTFGMLVTITGILLVIYHENRGSGLVSRNIRGFIFATIGAVAQAAAMVLSKTGMADGIHPISANVIRITAGFTGLVIFTVIRGELINDFKKMRDIKTLGILTISSLVGPVLGIILTLYALQIAPIGIVTTLMQTSPIILLPIEAVFLKRKITPPILLGTFIAVGGAVLLFLF